MKIYEKIANNKIAVLITGAHWTILFFTVGNFVGYFTDSGGERPDWIVYTVMILTFDLPAIIVAALVCSPLYIFLEDASAFWLGMLLISLFTITFQWLFIVKAIYNLFSKEEGKLIALSLNDD